jgi:type IV pilus assembly protein PilQ
MIKLFKYIFLLILVSALSQAFSQENRITELRDKLDSIAATSSPGLNDKVDISVSGVSIQEFIRALAITNKINITIDPSLKFSVVNNFSGETITNILLFLCKEYNLTITTFGSIINIENYLAKDEPRKIEMQYSMGLLSIELDNQKLDYVSKALTQLTNRNILVGDPSLNNFQVKAFIVRMPLRNALEKIAKVNGLQLDTTTDGFYIINKIQTVSTSDGRNSPGPKTGSNFNYSIHYDSLGEPLINIDAIQVSTVELIKLISKESKKNYIMFSEPVGSTTATFHMVSYPQLLAYLLKGSELTYKNDKAMYIIGDRKLEGLRTNKYFQLKYRSAKDLVDIIPAELKVDVEVKAFPELNSLLLSGSDPNIMEIEMFLTSIDQVVPVIMIELIVIDVNKTYTISTGLKAGVGDSARKSQGDILPYPDFTLNAESLNRFLAILNGTGVTNLGTVDKGFYVSLRALEDRGDINIRSNPRLSALNGHKASMKIGRKQYYLVQTQNVIGSVTPQTIITNQYIPTEANLAIDIEPVVSSDNQITLIIKVEFSSFIGTPSPNAPPPISTRQFESIIRIKDQELIILGGLEETEKSETGSGVPLLSRIPILKWFFSNKTKSKRDSKLIVVVKVTIIR